MVAWSEPGVEAIAGIVRKSAGLIFPAGRRSSIEEAIHRVMARAGARDLTGFVRRVRAERGLRDQLIAELTVGETYFFRERGQFDFIRAEIIPRLIRQRRPGEVLRVWSAGCATGEEAYSLAILFEEAGLAPSAHVLGTDISRRRLEAARRACYGDWSFRGVPAEVIDRYFERHRGYYKVIPRLRAAVDFRILNLAAESYATATAGGRRYDLILCRNVLIYLDPATIAVVARRLLDSLTDDGWLLLGASDPPLTELVPCTVVSTGSGLAYRRPDHRRPHAPPCSSSVRPLSSRSPAPLPTGTRITPLGDVVRADPFANPGSRFSASAIGIRGAPGAFVGGDVVYSAPTADPAGPLALADDLSVLRLAYERHDYERVIAVARSVIERGRETAEDWVLLVRSLANLGRFTEADRTCMSGLERHRLSAELTYLHAVLLLQAGHHTLAAAAARRALYLDRDLIVAHLALAHALALAGNRTAALRSLGNAARLLAALPEEVVVPASDGQHAGFLRGVVTTQVRLLGGMH